MQKLAEVVNFVKFTGMDVGGTVGTLAMSAPGLTGAVGLNALQFIVLSRLRKYPTHAAPLLT